MYYLWFHRLLYGFVWQFKATIRWRLSTKSKIVLFGIQRLQGQLFRIWEVLFAKISKRPNTCKFTWVLHRSISWKRARVFDRLCSSYQSIDTGNYIRLHFFCCCKFWYTQFDGLILFSNWFRLATSSSLSAETETKCAHALPSHWHPTTRIHDYRHL